MTRLDQHFHFNVFFLIRKKNNLHNHIVMNIILILFCQMYIFKLFIVSFGVLLSFLQDVLNNLGSSELDEDDLMLDLDLSDDQRHRHGKVDFFHHIRSASLHRSLYGKCVGQPYEVMRSYRSL